VSGGSHAANVASLRKWLLTTTSGNQELALGASRAASRTLSQISAEGAWQQPTNFHSTVKPTALMRWLVRLVTPPNGIVLDPFAGSGTTLLACKAEGFACVACELELDFCEIAKSRLA